MKVSLHFLLRLHKISEQVRSAQTAEVEIPMGERTLNKQFIKAVREEVVRKTVQEKLLQNPDVPFIKLRELAMRWTNSGTSKNRVVQVDSVGNHSVGTGENDSV